MSRLTILSEVVLPQPDGPTSTQILPAGTFSERSLTAPGVPPALDRRRVVVLRDMVEVDVGPWWWRCRSSTRILRRSFERMRWRGEIPDSRSPFDRDNGRTVPARSWREDHRHPARPPRRAARPAVPCRLGSRAAATSPRRSCGSRPTKASSASARATRWMASRRSSTCSSARIRWPSPATSGRSRRSTSTPAATGRSRSRCGTSPARSPACRSRRSSAARSDGLPAYASCGSLLPAAARAESALRLREEGFRALKIRVDPRRARGRTGRGRSDARRGRRHDGHHGRPQPGLADGRRHVAPRSTRRRPPDRRPAGRARRAVARGAARWARTCAGSRRSARGAASGSPAGR